MWTSSVLYVVGDVIAQNIEQRLGHTMEPLPMMDNQPETDGSNEVATELPPAVVPKGFSWDYGRSLRLATFGFVFAGPFFHGWFAFLERIAPGYSPKSVVIKVAVDQIVAAPFFVAMFYSSIGALEGKSVEDIKKKFEVPLFETSSSSSIQFQI